MIGVIIVSIALAAIYVLARRENQVSEERAWARKIARRYSEDPLPEPKKNGASKGQRSRRSAVGAYTRAAT